MSGNFRQTKLASLQFLISVKNKGEKEKFYSSIRLPRAAIFIILKSGKFFFLHKHACPLHYLILFIRSSSSRFSIRRSVLTRGISEFCIIPHPAARRTSSVHLAEVFVLPPAAVPPHTSLLHSLNYTIRYSQVYQFSCPL